MSSDLPPAAERAAAIAAELISRIIAGEYPPGSRLPSEAALCAMFQVSRSSVREALGRLSALELITTRRGAGGGAFVTRPAPQDMAARLAPILAVAGFDADTLRVARHGLLLACAARIDPERREITDLRAEIDLQSDFSISDAAFQGSRQRLMLALAAACDNGLLTALSQALVAADLGHADRDEIPTRTRARFLSYHVRMANALAAGRVDDLVQALAELGAFETELARSPQDTPPPEPERPPRMRDLPRPRVQRLGDGGQ